MKLVAGGLWLALAVVAGVDVAAPPPKAWWESVSLSAILAILAAATVSITTVITALRTGRTERAIKDAAPIVAAIQPKLEAMTMLMDPRLLQELADVKLTLANISNRQSDRTSAEVAQVKADEHVAMAVEVKAAETVAREHATNGTKVKS